MGSLPSAGIATEVKEATDRIQIPWWLFAEGVALDNIGQNITLLWLLQPIAASSMA